jgi:hypothetical protein
MVNGAIGWRVAVGVTALLLIALGIGRTVDGWRHAPLFAYVHAEWWGHSQADLLLDFEAWKPSTSRNSGAFSCTGAAIGVGAARPIAVESR